jgi:hypothetical protein
MNFNDFTHPYKMDLLRGNKVASEFIALCKKQMSRSHIREPTTEQDIQDHIDVFIDNIGYEIKAQKTNPDKPEFYVEDCFTIEYKNNAGYNGWIFGKAKYIAQEFNSVFLCYDRQQLLNWFIPRIDNYKPYTKPMNQSVVYYLPIKDCIDNLTTFTIFKSKFLSQFNLNPNKNLNLISMNTPFVQKPNTIILHNNTRKTDKHPHLRGTIVIEIDGVQHTKDIALWEKQSASGNTYFSGLVSEPSTKDNAPQTAKSVPTNAFNDNAGKTKDDLPF